MVPEQDDRLNKFFNGNIFEVRIWNSYRAAEIQVRISALSRGQPVTLAR